jgi:hypothetical protein
MPLIKLSQDIVDDLLTPDVPPNRDFNDPIVLAMAKKFKP